MEQYIPKSAVVAEIDGRIASLESIGSENYLHDNCPEQYAMLITLKSLKFDIDTLETKEVNLDREIKRYRMRNSIIQHREESLYDYMANVAKHFFELGMQASKKAQKGENI